MLMNFVLFIECSFWCFVIMSRIFGLIRMVVLFLLLIVVFLVLVMIVRFLKFGKLFLKLVWYYLNKLILVVIFCFLKFEIVRLICVMCLLCLWVVYCRWRKDEVFGKVWGVFVLNVV